MLRLLLMAFLIFVAGCNGDEEHPSPTEPPEEAPPTDPTVSAGLGTPGSARGDAPFPPEALKAAEVISADEMRGVVAELSSDAYGGREPGTEGDEKTRGYLVQQLVELGYSPGAGDSYQQPFDLVSVTADQPERWAFRKGGESRSFEQGSDFIVASGVQRESVSVQDAELVFVGYGIEAPEYDWNDFGDADLEGKVLVMLNNDPDWDPDLFEGERRLYYGRWTYKYESAARQGAAGAIIMHTVPSAGYPWQVVQTSWSGPQFELPRAGEPSLQAKGWMTEEAVRELLSFSGHDLTALTEAAKDRDFEPVPLGVTTRIDFENEIGRTRTANVLGLLEGRDPELSKEVVIYTAHHDHLGTDADPGTDDAIYNGALDNASGMAMVLEMAEAFRALPEPPRRSILINFVGAEEQGLLGSKYYAEHPTFPPGRMAAVLNFDGASIWGETEDVGYIGLGKSDLDEVARTVAEYQGRTLTGDQDPSKGYYYRSDQFSFARIGVPAIYPDAGLSVVGKPEGWGRRQIDAYTERHYHQPSDELTDAWDFSGMVQDAEFGFLAGYLIANQDELPEWNPGDEFADDRQRALEALGE